MYLNETACRFLQYTEQDCIDLLMRARWPDGFRCPKCDGAAHYRVSGRRLPLFACATCRRQCSLISGTVMERSRVPLRKWFTAIALISCGPISAVALAEQIRVTYKTAWLMLHKLRSAMSGHEELDRLTGLVRFELYKSGPQPMPWVRNLGDQEHPFVIGGSMEGGPDGRVLGVKLMLDTGGDTYQWKITPQGALRFIEKHIDLSGAVIDLRTDSIGRTRVFSLRKVAMDIAYAIASTHRGVGAKHRQSYLNEHAYRFNRSSRGQTTEQHLLQLSAASGAPTQKQLKSRTVPGRADWDTYRNVRRMILEFETLAARFSSQAAS
jgi:transposase-like protein